MSGTKRFKWVDRKTAAQDLMQLVYYAPQRISERTLWLLLAFPCQEIVSDLIAIALDSDRQHRERDYALIVLARVEGTIHAPELAAIIEEDFSIQRKYIRQDPEPNERIYDGTSFLCRSLYELVLAHPENIHWFCEALESIDDPRYARDVLTSSFAEDSNVNHILAKWLLSFLEKHKNIFSKDSISNAVMWFERSPKQSSQSAELAESQSPSQADTMQKYEGSPVWQELTTLYKAALDGDVAAFQNIRRIATGWNNYLPLQGVAVYFLGQLQNQFDVLDELCSLVKVSRDNWYFDDSDYPYHPVRAEAIWALQCNSSARAWEALIDGFFVNPSNSLDYRFFDAIEYVTELLTFNSEKTVAERNRWLEIHQTAKPSAPWFDILCEMDRNLEFYCENWHMSRIN